MKNQEYEETSRVTVDATSELKEEIATTLNPLNIGRLAILPKRKVYCIVIKVPLMRDLLQKMAEIVKKYKIVMLSGMFSLDNSNPNIVNAVAFIDLTDSSVKPKELVANLGHVSSIKEVQIFAPKPSGFVCDNFFFPLKVANERVIIFRKPIYEALFSGIRKEFGSAGEAFLYYMGVESGSKLFEDYKNIIGSADTRSVIDMACAFAFNMGWGIFKIKELNLKKKIVQVRIYDNFECTAVKEAGKPYSHFLRGVSAGLYLNLFKTKGIVEETKCIAQGDPFCEFVCKPAKP